mmetsp:Transcript_17090/g.28119  ORF Transcript_17090/g.28119 Transcript_17090/m.28119 type:complete len:104 (+) Transcript_17090:167-478(+)
MGSCCSGGEAVATPQEQGNNKQTSKPGKSGQRLGVAEGGGLDLSPVLSSSQKDADARANAAIAAEARLKAAQKRGVVGDRKIKPKPENPKSLRDEPGLRWQMG